jgi:signal transduction histidine kinase
MTPSSPERHEAQQRLLWESAAALLSSERLETTLPAVFDKVALLVDADAYLCFVVDDAHDTLLLDSSRGIGDAELATLATPGAERPWTDAIGRAPFVFSESQESAEADLSWARQLGLRAAVGNPLLVDGRLIGTLIVGTRQKAAFRPDELEFLHSLCHYVAAAYERMALIWRLRETDRRKDQFLATLAHELRNPLAPIRNALEIMRVNSRAPSPVEEAARRMIERQLEQLVRLVDDLLDVSRVAGGRPELRKGVTELSAVIRSAIETARPLVDAAQHELSVTLPQQPVYLDADPTALAQVFSSLLHDAARYMDKGGRIRLEAEAHDGVATVSVGASGGGIAPESLPHIFDPSARADESPDGAPAGFDRGLALVKRLVELHAGTIEAHSDGPGRGAKFTVRLHLTPTRATAERPRVAQPFTHISEHSMAHRILVADDNKDAAESMGMLLRLMGNEVRTVYDGEKAVAEAEEFRPDMVVLDIGMPKLDGYAVARMIREQPWSSGTVLVALTGWGQEEDKRKAAEAGFDRHFTKPIDPAELQRLVAERGG